VDSQSAGSSGKQPRAERVVLQWCLEGLAYE
jgi:hypothetical protein